MSSTTTSEESSTSSPADIIKGWETDRLIKFLRNDKDFKDLGLNDGFFTKLEDEKITGQLFLMLTKWKFFFFFFFFFFFIRNPTNPMVGNLRNSEDHTSELQSRQD